MATNLYFSQSVASEQSLYEDLTIEAIKMYGNDNYYLPRDIVNEDEIFGEDIPSAFDNSYKLEMYLENIEGYDGEGDLFTKFGVEIRDQVTFVVSRRRWVQSVAQFDNTIAGERPREGDLIYVPLSKSLFQIMHVEHEQPFYQLSNLPVFKVRCELFEYSGEDLDTGITEIDSIEQTGYEFEVTLSDSDSDGTYTIGQNITWTHGVTGVVITGEVSHWNDSDNILSLVHLSSTDSDYSMITTDYPIVGTAAEENDTPRTILSVNHSNDNDAQNTDFKTEGIDFIDFSETNPFGEPESS